MEKLGKTTQKIELLEKRSQNLKIFKRSILKNRRKKINFKRLFAIFNTTISPGILFIFRHSIGMNVELDLTDSFDSTDSDSRRSHNIASQSEGSSRHCSHESDDSNYPSVVVENTYSDSGNSDYQSVRVKNGLNSCENPNS